MMVNKFTTTAVVLVVVCAAAMVHGHPHSLEEDFGEPAEMTTVAAKTGVRGWIKNMHDKIRGDHNPDCNHNHGGVFNWVKNKLGFAAKTTTPMTPTTPTVATVVTTAEATNDYGGGNDRDGGISETNGGSSSSDTSGGGGGEEDPPSAEHGETESRDVSAEEPQSGDFTDPLIDPRIRV